MERFAVYRCYSDHGHLLYVGETKANSAIPARESALEKLWFVQVRGITLEWYADELEALKAERRAIHVEHPKHNKQHRETTSRAGCETKGHGSEGKHGQLVPAEAPLTTSLATPGPAARRGCGRAELLPRHEGDQAAVQRHDRGLQSAPSVILDLAQRRHRSRSVVSIGDRKTS